MLGDLRGVETSVTNRYEWNQAQPAKYQNLWHRLLQVVSDDHARISPVDIIAMIMRAFVLLFACVASASAQIDPQIYAKIFGPAHEMLCAARRCALYHDSRSHCC